MNPIKITDTTFRDGHQSLMATRLRTRDMEPIAAEMGKVGFHSMEVWGGATFDTMTRFLAEDPWERLRIFKSLIPETPLMMLLRGQSLVGYRNYADDVVESFVKQAAETGIDIFRVFDALNDERNLEVSAKEIKRSGKHLQMAICYSVTEGGKLGGPIYNVDYFLDRAKTYLKLGADSICIKDMAGLLAPYDAFELFTALKQVVDVPLQLHTHYTSGMASMACIKAIEAGVDVVDASLSPLALRTSQPAVEPLVTTYRGTERDTGFDLDSLINMGNHLENALAKYQEYLASPNTSVIDPKVLSHQIPGGMASNLTSQLKEAGALNRLDEVLAEIPRTRKELGYPPLVTPMSQMVGTQAVMNVLFGRYEVVGEEIKNYVSGQYGRPPAQFDIDVAAKILGDYEESMDYFSKRPGDTISPEMETASNAVQEISSELDDILTYALYPTTGMRFLRIKYGLDQIPEEMKQPSDITGTVDQSQKVQKLAGVLPSKGQKTRSFNVFVGEEVYQVEVDPVDITNQSSHMEKDRQESESVTASNNNGLKPSQVKIEAPMPGIVVRYEVEVGQNVEVGDTLVILESMKMENLLPSQSSGKIKELSSEPGIAVDKGDVLAIIDV